MELRLHFPQSAAGNAFAHLPRGLVGKWGMDGAKEKGSPRNLVCDPANGGGRGR